MGTVSCVISVVAPHLELNSSLCQSDVSHVILPRDFTKARITRCKFTTMAIADNHCRLPGGVAIDRATLNGRVSVLVLLFSL